MKILTSRNEHKSKCIVDASTASSSRNHLIIFHFRDIERRGSRKGGRAMCLWVFALDDGWAFYCLLFSLLLSTEKWIYGIHSCGISAVASSIIVSSCVFVFGNWLQTFSASDGECKWIVLYDLMICREEDM